MPRTARALVANACYHFLNRANRRDQVFHDFDDYAAFAHLLRQTDAHVSMRIIKGACHRKPQTSNEGNAVSLPVSATGGGKYHWGKTPLVMDEQ
jgi:hypothetical protein